MSELAIQLKKISARLELLEEKSYDSSKDYQPAVLLCKKYQIGRNLRYKLVRNGIIGEYKLMGKIFLKETEIIAALNSENKEKKAA